MTQRETLHSRMHVEISQKKETADYEPCLDAEGCIMSNSLCVLVALLLRETPAMGLKQFLKLRFVILYQY